VIGSFPLLPVWNRIRWQDSRVVRVFDSEPEGFGVESRTLI
jgi:hypothetical protein